jgi:hypothetical protein
MQRYTFADLMQRCMTGSETFCLADCVAMMDPAFAANREIEHSLGHLKGAKDHMKNSAGNCVSWCPACSAGGKEVKP